MRIVAAAALVTALACAAAALSPAAVPLEITARHPALSAAAASNIRAADYVGPEVCGQCHGDRYRQWSGNLHRAMNRLASEAATEDGVIAGDFSGVELVAGDVTARFERDASGAPVMIVGERHYAITRTIGSRYIQEYVGRDGDGPEVRLPFGYWISRGRWYHNQYYDSWYGPEYSDAGEPTADVAAPDAWDTRCAWCHNTYPFELRIARAAAGRIAAFGPEADVTAPTAPRPAIAGDNRLPTGELVTIGISCESCHFGGRDHAIDGAPIRFEPVAPDLRRVPGGRDLSGGRASAVAVNAICSQCHSAPAPRWPDGSAQRNSREALDLAGSRCAPRCTDCHDPHRKGPGGGSADNPDHLAACARCHADKTGAGHARHAPSDASCLDCHMPRVVQGFSHVVRSHRISSPRPAQIIAGDHPDACGLCHLDRSARELLGDLDRLWGLRLSRGAAPPGIDVDTPVGDAWLASERSIVAITAADAFARRGRREDVARLLDRLDDPVAYARMRMLIALEDLTGERWEPARFDPRRPPGRRWIEQP